MTKIPVDSIKIPYEYFELCMHWHGNQDCMLYAVCSTGGLTLGTIRPRGCDSDEKWYLTIWRELSSDVAYARRSAEKGCNFRAGYDDGDGEGHDADYPALVEFEEWVDAQCERLCVSYGLEDWDGE